MKDSSEAGLEIALVDTVAIVNIRDISGDFLEIALDSLLDDGLGKDIPIIGTFFRIYGATLSIKDRLFIKKVYRFLFETGKASPQEREEFVQNLKGKEDQRKVGETVIQILDRLESYDKATIAGQIFKAHIEKRIDYETVLLLWKLLDNLHLPDLNVLVNHHKNNSIKELDKRICERLAYAGLMNLAGNTPGFSFQGANDPYATINNLGKTFIESILLAQ